MAAETTITSETAKTIERILKAGNQAEVKIENGKVTVIEIKRKLRHKE